METLKEILKKYLLSQVKNPNTRKSYASIIGRVLHLVSLIRNVRYPGDLKKSDVSRALEHYKSSTTSEYFRVVVCVVRRFLESIGRGDAMPTDLELGIKRRPYRKR